MGVAKQTEQERVIEAAINLFSHTSRDPSDPLWVKVRPQHLDELREALIAFNETKEDS